MKRTQKLVVSIGTAISLGIAALAVSADPGQMGAGMGPGAHGGMGPGTMRHGAQAPQAAQQLMTPEERTATQEKMRAAKTPEERQQIATATRTEMEKRAKEKGITLPEPRGHHGHHGVGPSAAAPATTEHVH